MYVYIAATSQFSLKSFITFSLDRSYIHSSSTYTYLDTKIMNLETEIISTENVKPSSPTPHHLQRYNLSMLDQTVPHMPVPIVLYYPATPNNDPSYSETLINQLKSSLSLILTRFYPLAGRINEDFLSVDCNDNGVPFVVAKINGHYKLSDVLQTPDPNLPCKLIPCKIKWDTEPGPGSSVFMIQLTLFHCGGFSIGVVFWHKAADAATIGHFLKCWARTSLRSGYKEPVCPNYIAPSLFPQSREMQASTGSLGAILNRGKSVMRRYVFDAHAISTLKTLASNDDVSRPSRVEVVSALIWRCFMAASLANGRSESAAMHAVNLRSRAHPPFPSDSFGNFPCLSAAYCPNEEITNYDQLGHLVRTLREAIRKIDSDFVNRMLGDQGFLGHRENLGRVWGQIPKIVDLLSFSSWCGFGFYEVDFGWGTPIWITRCDAGNDDEESAFLNVVWLMDSRIGDGLEAWVTLDEKYMQIFDTIEELTAIACRDPSPLSVVGGENYIS